MTRPVRLPMLLVFGLFAACGATALEQGDEKNVTAAIASAQKTSPPGPVERLRLMEGNISTGDNQSYDPGEGARLLQGLQPDIVTLQELNIGDNTPATVRAWVNTTFGESFSYFREDGAQIPNGIISRYPILASGSWTDPAVANRGLAWARVDIPGPTDLWMISVHLLTSSSTHREDEAVALVSHIQAEIPSTDWIVLGGDFNTATRSEACVTTLSHVFVTSGPYPVDNAGNENTSGNRSKPHDWLLVNAGLAAQEIPVTIGANTFAHGLVVDTRVYAPLSDIAPALAGDSGAVNMQHMPVVRDFILPH